MVSEELPAHAPQVDADRPAGLRGKQKANGLQFENKAVTSPVNVDWTTCGPVLRAIQYKAPVLVSRLFGGHREPALNLDGKKWSEDPPSSSLPASSSLEGRLARHELVPEAPRAAEFAVEGLRDSYSLPKLSSP